jgi:hypothetical protein
MRLVTGQEQIIAEFVGAGLKLKFNPPLVAMGWVDVGPAGNWRLVSGAVFNDYNGASIEISIFGRMTRQTIRESYGYVFGQLGCGRLTARTKRSNLAMRRMLPRLGFVLEGELKRFFGSTSSHNALIYRLEAETAHRWLYGVRTLGPDSA